LVRFASNDRHGVSFEMARDMFKGPFAIEGVQLGSGVGCDLGVAWRGG